MIAPNSPRLAAKAVTSPETMPGSANGTVIFTRRSRAPAPSVSAAIARLDPLCSRARRMARTCSGKVMRPDASAAPVQLKKANGNRRQHQRQVDEAIHDRPANESHARKKEGDQEGERQSGGDCDQR